MSHLLMIYGMIEPSNIIYKDFFYYISNEYDKEIVFRDVLADRIKKSDIEWADIVLVVRPQRFHTSWFFKYAKRRNRFTMLLMDDDLLSVERPYMKVVYGTQEVKKSLKYSDVVISPNDSLKNKLLRYSETNRGVVLHTGISDNEIKSRVLKDRDSINIVLYSVSGELESFNNIIIPILDKLNNTFPMRINWTFYNLHPDLSSTEYSNRVNYYSTMPLKEFRDSMFNGDYDFGIMPLIDNEFNRGKYVNHFLEFSRAGIPGIYSNVYPYKGFVNSDVDGILSDNTIDGWLEAFSKMMDYSFRVKISNNAQNRLKKEFAMKSLYDKFLCEVPELHSYRTLDKFKFKLSIFPLIKLIDWINENVFKWFAWVIELFRVSRYTRWIRKFINTH